MSDALIIPDWPLTEGVHSLVTTRIGGNSALPYSSNNLALHVGDVETLVQQNRAQLRQHLPADPYWLNQTHSTEVVCLDAVSPLGWRPPEADGSYTREAGKVCVVMTADCLPILLCSKNGAEIAAVHAGWRGLADGIVSRAVQQFTAKPCDILAYLGPAISGDYFEVGDDVRTAFYVAGQQRGFAQSVGSAFQANNTAGGGGQYFADLYALARAEFKALGVEHIFGGDCCTFSDTERFFSYRREGVTGRMASCIWIENR